MIVVDATVAVKWVLSEVDSSKALDLVADTTQAGEDIIAPTLLRYEATNVLRKRMLREAMPFAEAEALLAALLAYPLTYLDPPGLHQAALAIANAHNLPAAYDAHYLALAQQYQCEFWTADTRLINLLGGALPFVKTLSNYS